MKMNPKDILTPTVSLFVICLVATLLLAIVNNVTAAKGRSKSSSSSGRKGLQRG